MKYCAKCGIQMEDEAKMCPQCNFPVFDPTNAGSTQIKPSKKKPQKLFIIISLIIAIAALIIIFFILSHDSTTNGVESNLTAEPTSISTKPVNTTSSMTETTPSTSPVAELPNSVCPAQEYGNHSWSAATCIEPAKCNYCGIYKDDKLGHHKFWYIEDIDEEACFWCDMLREDYDNQKG